MLDKVCKLIQSQAEAKSMCKSRIVRGKCEGDAPMILVESVVGGACHQEVTKYSVMVGQIMVSDCQRVAEHEWGERPCTTTIFAPLLH